MKHRKNKAADSKKRSHKKFRQELFEIYFNLLIDFLNFWVEIKQEVGFYQPSAVQQHQAAALLLVSAKDKLDTVHGTRISKVTKEEKLLLKHLKHLLRNFKQSVVDRLRKASESKEPQAKKQFDTIRNELGMLIQHTEDRCSLAKILASEI